MQTAASSNDVPPRQRIVSANAEAAAALSPDPLETAARSLQDSGRYRVLRRIEPRPVTLPCDAARRHDVRVGVVLDTETTGLDHSRDEVVELAMIKFRYLGTGILEIVGVFEGLRQPSRALAPEVADLTGLTDAMLEGRTIDFEEVGNFLKDVNLVIAHNAKFDRPFAEDLHPAFSKLAWACSATEIPWRSLGVEGTKLGYLLAAFGLFHAGHRALADCHALLEVLDRRPPRGDETGFACIVESSQRTTATVHAVDAPFAIKDVLKRRGYRWSNGSDGKARCWHRELPEADLDEELRYLREEIYRRDVVLPVTVRGAVDRHRA